MIDLNHQFNVPLAIDDAWRVLTDLPTVARCLPGAHLDTAEGEEYRGGLSAKIGPITARYRGAASFRERDEIAHRAVVEARGQEEKGSGSASALITMVLKPDGESTVVDVSTQMNISGRAAQFGRSLLAEVSSTLMGQFADNLASLVSNGAEAVTGSEAGTATATSSGDSSGAAAADGVRGAGTSSAPGGAELDVVATIVLPMLKRAAIPLGAGLVGLAVGLVLRRNGRTATTQGGGIPLTYVLPYPGGPQRADW